MSETKTICDICELPDPYNGAGDGVTSCGCLPGDDPILVPAKEATDV